VSTHVSTENNASVFKIKNWGNMFPPNTDANTGDNPAHHFANLITGFKREWKEDSKASSTECST